VVIDVTQICTALTDSPFRVSNETYEEHVLHIPDDALPLVAASVVQAIEKDSPYRFLASSTFPIHSSSLPLSIEITVR
jgi:hypothetical protein